MIDQSWFAVRTLFCHSKSKMGKAIYEEKITLYLAAGINEAQQLAESDANQYVELNNGFSQLKTYEIFVLGHDDSRLDKHEVWSTLLEGPEDIDTFVREKYNNFSIDATE